MQTCDSNLGSMTGIRLESLKLFFQKLQEICTHLEGLTLGTLIPQILYKIPPPGGGYSFQTRLEWGDNLFNLAKMVVLVLHKEAESNVEKLKYMK